MLNIVLKSVVVLNVIMLSVVMMNVVAPNSFVTSCYKLGHFRVSSFIVPWVKRHSAKLLKMAGKYFFRFSGSGSAKPDACQSIDGETTSRNCGLRRVAGQHHLHRVQSGKAPDNPILQRARVTSGLYYKTIMIVIVMIVSDPTIWSVTYDRN